MRYFKSKGNKDHVHKVLMKIQAAAVSQNILLQDDNTNAYRTVSVDDIIVLYQICYQVLTFGRQSTLDIYIVNAFLDINSTLFIFDDILKLSIYT